MSLHKNNEKKILSLLKAKRTNSITSKEYNSIVKSPRNKIKINKTMTASEYREFLSTKTKGVLKVKNNELFSFTFNIKKIDNQNYLFTLLGRHRRTNECNSWASMGKRGAYKNAIKKAANDYCLINRKYLKSILPLTPSIDAEMYSIAYNPKSRDDDGNSVTLKYLRDILTNLNFIKDDNRKYFIEKDRKEVLQKEYKIEIYLKLNDKNEKIN